MVFCCRRIRILRDPARSPRPAAASCLVRELLQERGMRLFRFLVLVSLALPLGGACGSVLGTNDGGGGAAGGTSGHGGAAGGGSGGGPTCGPVQCDAGMVCCNAGCGICTPPGGVCVAGCPAGGSGGGGGGGSSGGAGRGGAGGAGVGGGAGAGGVSGSCNSDSDCTWRTTGCCEETCGAVTDPVPTGTVTCNIACIAPATCGCVNHQCNQETGAGGQGGAGGRATGGGGSGGTTGTGGTTGGCGTCLNPTDSCTPCGTCCPRGALCICAKLDAGITGSGGAASGIATPTN
jgi:hypothetical protein